MPAFASTSLSQLRVRRAIGLLGALAPGPEGMPCSVDWLGPGPVLACGLSLAPSALDR